MKLLSHAAAEMDVMESAQPELVERAHEHLNGHKPTGPKIVLKKLSNRHKQAVALVIQGADREDICSVTRFTPQYITFLLQQPLVQDFIAEVNRGVAVQLDALYGKSVQAIAGGLGHSDPDVKLRAAKLQLQTTGRLEPNEGSGKTAEDVVSAILLGVNVNVNR